MHHLPRKEIESTFMGRLCFAAHPISAHPPDCYWLRLVTPRLDQSYIPSSDFRLQGSGGEWWTTGVIPLTISQNERFLVVDIVRDVSGPRPIWGAIILHKEQTYFMILDQLVLDGKQ